MSGQAYYNEINSYAAQWLRNLIDAGQIAPGIVDERSIEDVHPSDLAGFTQCHFFAGIGVWSYALRRAGWPDDRPVWTGSCPCQPFSEAGKGVGFDDERHLWPHFHWLISQRRPPVIYGEQVASADAGPWLDLVQADLEAMGHAFGVVPFPSASVGAPHIRDRNFWVAHADSQQRAWATERAEPRGRHVSRHVRRIGGMADAQQHDRGREATAPNHFRPQADRSADWPGGCGGAPGALADDDQERRRWWQGISARRLDDGADARRLEGNHGPVGSDEAGFSRTAAAGPTNGLWRDADWLLCRDGKWRPVEPGTFPLAHGAPSRVGRLRAYGNAINAQAAEIFIRATL